MKPELRAKIYRYNKEKAENEEKATDMVKLLNEADEKQVRTMFAFLTHALA